MDPTEPHVQVRCRFTDLGTVIDQLHTLFGVWHRESLMYAHSLDLMKVAVHEWVANLVQYADFQGRHPEIYLEVSPNGQEVHCRIEDNSEGFDLAAQLLQKAGNLSAFPERGMGLLMLQACSDNLTYTRTEIGRYRLEFSVSAAQDPWLNIPF
jgi:serine/threonine-protein kinase RsbW